MNFIAVLIVAILISVLLVLSLCQIGVTMLVVHLLRQNRGNLPERVPPPKKKKEAAKTTDDEKRSQSVLDVIEKF